MSVQTMSGKPIRCVTSGPGIVHQMLERTRLCAFAISCVTLFVAGSPTIYEDDAERQKVIQALSGFSSFVGEWRGVAQPKRGSSAGAWSEKCKVAWQFAEGGSGLVFRLDPGQQFRTLTLMVRDSGDTSAKQQILIAEDSAGQKFELSPEESTNDQTKSDDVSGVWSFATNSSQDAQRRCTIRAISEIRMTLLFEERASSTASWKRLSEIGLTRAGEKLAKGNTGGPQCIVTGGLGTIRVEHDGKAYYVCCEGCKQAFDADPAGTIQDYRDRLSKESSGSKDNNKDKDNVK